MNNTHLDQAREWARDNIEGGYFHGGDRALAAAHVIQSLPDHWIDAEKVREILAEQYMKIEGNDRKWINAATIESLLTPPLPTLADMTPEEREACQWMQVERVGKDELSVIIAPNWHKNAAFILHSDGMNSVDMHEELRPRPDLPRLEWPAQEPQPEYRPNLGPITLSPPTSEEEGDVRGQFEEPTLADLISPEDVPAEEPWLVKHDGHKWVGTRESRVETVCSWTLARLDGADYTVARDDEITLVSRLVPEDKP